MIEVRGRVVGPDGKPVPGAAVRTAYLDPESATAPRGDQWIGRPVPHAGPATAPGAPACDAFPWVVALAPGFGPGWVSGALKAGAAGELTIRLVEDGPPIEGRIVDLEGRPVAGARVKVERLWFARTERDPYVETGDLSAWIATVQDRGILLTLGWPGSVADGDRRPPRPTATAGSA